MGPLRKLLKYLLDVVDTYILGHVAPVALDRRFKGEVDL